MEMKWFSEEEVNCPCGCGATLNTYVKKALDTLREAYGKPVYVEQAGTCENYSVNHVGRNPTSTHIDSGDGALAVDVKKATFDCKEDYFHFLSCAYDAGFTGFGQGIGWFDVHKKDKRLHIDMRDVEDIITWVYYDKD